MKKKKNQFFKKYLITILLFTLLLTLSTYFLLKNIKIVSPKTRETPKAIAQRYNIVTKTVAKPTPAATSSAKPPQPKPLTFSEMNQLYGPCAYVPTFMYHHIQNLDVAKKLGHAQLTVATDIFRQQMQYLKNKGYTTIKMQDLINFFDKGSPLPPKSILITIDDGYDDFGTDAAPIIKELGLNATIFIPTGLMNNSGYLTWDTINNLSNSPNFYFANHTWSHHAMATSKTEVEKEVTLADTQLKDHGLNQSKVFAYPYGSFGSYVQQFLGSQGYTLAFTTIQGSTLCKKQRLNLPRVRIGNAQLSAYGF